MDYILKQEKDHVLLDFISFSNAEITGTLSMKWASVSGGHTGFILMLAMIALSYIFLPLRLKIALGGLWPTLWKDRYFTDYPVQRAAV